MNRTDRLFAIILELQAKGQLRAEDLAAIFETSKRTIYRDMQALAEAGVPIVSMTGQGYSLTEGYFLPPLRFSTEEAIMLLLGSASIAHSFDEHYCSAAASASRKIEAVLPELLRAEVREVQDCITLIVDAANEQESDLLRQLRRAILERRQVRFRYHARSREGAAQLREVDPYGLVNFGGTWYLMGHDHLRHDLRHFRLERMEALSLSAHHFARPVDFRVELRAPTNERPLVVRVLFDRDVARWVRESRNFFVVQEEDTPQGLLVTLRVREAEEIVSWLLSWGGRVRVLEPEVIRQRLTEAAHTILKNNPPPTQRY
ncbi:MAG: YafY family transcriptional regulator [Chloroflexi bacterium]|nr:YafY family transcriptional regulator [Chloroflexota bacterium]